jgi:hypothetical protein
VVALVVKKAFGSRSANWKFMQLLEAQIANKSVDGAGLGHIAQAQKKSLVSQSK